MIPFKPKKIVIQVLFTFFFLIPMNCIGKSNPIDSLKYYKKELKNQDSLEFSKVLYLYRKAKVIANTQEKVLLILDEGRYYVLLGIKDEAYLAFQNALSLSQKNNFKILEALSYKGLSDYYFYFNRYDLSYQNLLKCKTILESTSQEEESAFNKQMNITYLVDETLESIMNNIGILAVKNNDFENAQVHLEESLNLCTKIQDKHGILVSKVNLANLSYEKGEYIKSNESLFQLLNESLDSKEGQMHIYYSISNNYYKLDQITKSLTYIDKAIELSKELNNDFQLANLLFDKAKILEKLKHYKKAIILLEKSIKISEKFDDLSKTIIILNKLVDIEKLENNPQKANIHYKKILSLKDSIKEREDLGSYKEIILANKLEQQEELNNKQQILIDNERWKSKTYFAFIVLGVFMFGTLILAYYYSRANSKKELLLLRNEVQIREIELENKQKDELIKSNEIRNKLNQNKRELLSALLYRKKRKERVKKVIKEIDEISGKSIIRKNDLLTLKKFISYGSEKLEVEESVKQQINNTQKEFFSSIQKTYPKLTKTDLKILAFLRIDLDTKEIAELQGVSVDAIRKSRHRIRKKLDLSPKESLENFIYNYH